MDATDHRRLVALAQSLADNHADMMASLVAIRRGSLTQSEVAERMGVTQPTVAAIERYDANPTLSTLERYALAVGATIETRVEKARPDTTLRLGHAPAGYVWGNARIWTSSETYGREDGVGNVPVWHMEATLLGSTENPSNILSMTVGGANDIVPVKVMT